MLPIAQGPKTHLMGPRILRALSIPAILASPCVERTRNADDPEKLSKFWGLRWKLLGFRAVDWQ